MKGLVRAVTVLCVLGAVGLVLWRVWPLPAERGAAGDPGAAAGGASTLGQFTPLDRPRPAPDVEFASRAGAPIRLADFRGRVVLVNLWATWCGPCVHEMPSLDRLQARLGGDLVILAVSEDRSGARAVDPFLARLAPKALTAYLDPKNALTRAFAAQGLPTSILLDRDGRILGRLEGAADWDSPEMIALLQRYIGSGQPPVRKAAAG